jgi:CRISPR/Cas system-associated exonuclease Cas4 (RecB family)
MAKFVRGEVKEEKGRPYLAEEFLEQVNEFYSLPEVTYDVDIERLLWEQKKEELFFYSNNGLGKTDRPILRGSSSSKCKRELFYSFTGNVPYREQFPYHRRWTRNSSAVHEYFQRDLLYMEKYLKEPSFIVRRTDSGMPAWEENVRTRKYFGSIVLEGMGDGQLVYKDDSVVGFEFKTKSNTLGQLGDYKLREPAPYHVEQLTAYSFLFDIREWIICYESVVKPQWSAGIDAKPDIKAFYVYITQEMREQFLDKVADLDHYYTNKKLPDVELDKCMMCEFKELCVKERGEDK